MTETTIEAPDEAERASAAPPTRGNLMLRFCFGAMLASAALWLPINRVIWSLATAQDGVFEDAVVFDEDVAETHAVDSGGGDGAVTSTRRVVFCRYADGQEELSFTDQSGLQPGALVPVAYLPSEPQRAVRAKPGTGAFGLYFATKSWIVDAALWPIGLVLALATLLNLVALRSAKRT